MSDTTYDDGSFGFSGDAEDLSSEHSNLSGASPMTPLDKPTALDETIEYLTEDVAPDRAAIIKPVAKAQIKALMLSIVGEDEVDETGINSGTQWGLRIENRNKLRAELRERIKSL